MTRKDPTPFFKKETALDSLMQRGIIDETMKEAAYTYAEICHQRPTGGPKMSHMPRTFNHSRTGPTNNDTMPDHLESLWRHMHHILQHSPVGELLSQLILDDNVEALAVFDSHPEARIFLREALRDLVYCVKKNGEVRE